jgi:hypothetical protein
LAGRIQPPSNGRPLFGARQLSGEALHLGFELSHLPHPGQHPARHRVAAAADDSIGRQNIIDFNLGLACSPFAKATLGLTGHFFWRADTSDAVYNAGGTAVRAGGLGSSSEVGQEIDLTLKNKFDRHLVGLLGYSHFFAGDFIEESGSSDDIDFLYVQLEYTF